MILGEPATSTWIFCPSGFHYCGMQFLRDSGAPAEEPDDNLRLVSRAQPSSASSADPKFLFVIGAPRSGTSWIQKSLAQQPGWVTVPELHYASEVLRPVLKAWNRRSRVLERSLHTMERAGHQPSRIIGMPASLEFDEIVDALRAPFDFLVRRADTYYGSVQVFIEKTPGNSVLTPYIDTVFPESYILHVLRDPRSTAQSLRSASSSEWAKGWAPKSVIVCALLWRVYVAGALRARSDAARYLEVKYEDAQRSLPKEIERISGWVGVRSSDEDSAMDGTSRDRFPDRGLPGSHQLVSSRVARTLGSAALTEPADFGDGSRSHPELTRLQVWLIEAITARLMHECGYGARYRTATWFNHVLEELVTRTIARLPDTRKEDLAMNIRRLRLFSWLGERLQRHS